MSRLSLKDVILLPYTPDLTQVGIAHALQALPTTAALPRPEVYQTLRCAVMEQAAELGFRRQLVTSQVPHQLVTDSHFASSGKTCVRIGGRICDVTSSALVQKTKIRRLHRDPASLLSNLAILSREALATQPRNDTDLLIFCFVTALLAASLSASKQAALVGLPVSLVFPLPVNWSGRSNRPNLGKLVLKSESTQPVHLSLIGQAGDRSPLSEEVTLTPGLKVEGVNQYHSLTYLKLEQLPAGRLAIRSTGLRKTLLISPFQWGNIWVYGMQIYLAGWITREEFSRCASLHSVIHEAWQPVSPGSKYMALPVSELHPLEELFSKARQWAER